MCVARCGTLVTQAQCHGATQDTDTIIKVSSECCRPACSSSAALCSTLRYDDRDCDTDPEAILKTASTLGGLKLQLERFTFWTDCMQARVRQLC